MQYTLIPLVPLVPLVFKSPQPESVYLIKRENCYIWTFDYTTTKAVPANSLR
jgi:hypothetical protein